MTDIKKPCPICGQETEGLNLEPESMLLKPCPICGSEHTELFTVPGEAEIKFIAGCTVCGTRTRECIDHLSAIEIWNTREPDMPSKIISKLRKLLAMHGQALYDYDKELRTAGYIQLAYNLRAIAMEQEQALDKYLGEDQD